MRRSLPMIDLSPLSVGPVRCWVPLAPTAALGSGEGLRVRIENSNSARWWQRVTVKSSDHVTLKHPKTPPGVAYKSQIAQNRRTARPMARCGVALSCFAHEWGFGRRAKIATARCPGAGRGGARDDQGQGQPGSQRGAGTTHERDLLLRGQTCTFRASCKVPGRP